MLKKKKGSRQMARQHITEISFAKVYPLYIAKAERKQRSKAEVAAIIQYDQAGIDTQVSSAVSMADFFTQAPRLNPARKMITGVICGIRVEEIEEPMVQEIRYLDKLIDELAKGKALQKILRES